MVTLEPIFHDEGGAVKDFDLSAFVTVDAEGNKFEVSCRTNEGVVTERVPLMKGNVSVWHGMYSAAHLDDVGITDWTILTDSGSTGVYTVTGAERRFDRPGFTPPSGWGRWSELSTFTLTFAPAP